MEEEGLNPRFNMLLLTKHEQVSVNNHCTKQAFISTIRHALYPPTSHHLCHTYLLRKCQSGGEVGQMVNIRQKTEYKVPLPLQWLNRFVNSFVECVWGLCRYSNEPTLTQNGPQ